MSAEEPDRTQASSSELKAILGATAAAVGLVGSLYLVGWVVDLVRFAAARLPAGPTASTLSAQELFGDGLRSTLLMAAAFAVSCALAYFTSRRNWDVHGQDWHDIIRKGGVAKAASEVDVHERERRQNHRAAGKAKGGQEGPPKPRAPAALGDWAVRIIAGYNIMVLSALVAIGVVRAAGALVPSPIARWVAVAIGIVAFFLVRLVLTRVSPLVLHSRVHGVVWAAIVVATLFASAPIGVLLLTVVAIATLGRTLARLIPQPHSPAEFLRSPLPWILLTICLLVGLAYSATPPVSFPQVLVTTPTGNHSGGYLTRTSAGVYVVTCTALADATSTAERVDLIPAQSVRDVRIGGHPDYVDSGNRPSLATLALRGLGIGGHVPTVFSADLHATQPTCVGGGPSSLATGTEDPSLGTGVIAAPAPAGGQAHDGESPIQVTSPTIAALARRYQPTLLVTVADRNWPTSVGAVLAERGLNGERACLVQQRTTKPVCPATPSSLSGSGAVATDYLQLPVGLGSHLGPDGQFQAFLRGQYTNSGAVQHWLADPGVLDPWYSAEIYFYVRSISSSLFPAKARDPNVPAHVIALEYWFYYPLNYYPLVVNGDLMTEAPLAGDHANVDLHQGDWEHIDVLLDPRTMTPIWLYMARHSFEGQFVPWGNPSLTYDHGHVVVQAAFGGHPTYLPGCGARVRKATAYLSSDWLSCGSGRFAFRAATTPLVDIAQTPWRCWPGHFGEATRLEVNNAKVPESIADKVDHFVYVAGPGAPLQQAENTGVCAGNPATAELKATGAAKRPGH